MDPFHILILALIQALAEFLPISSSGHLVLTSWWLGWDYQGISFDLALHLGTLIAILLYFRRDVRELMVESLRWRPGKPMNAAQKLALALALSTLPAVVVGMLMGETGALLLREPALIAAMLIGFGLLLGWADLRDRNRLRTISEQAEFDARASRVFADLRWSQALLIGCAQALALIPGTSRSGVTMTAALMLGLNRAEAARFSFLMAIPITVLAIVHGLAEALRHDERLIWGDLVCGAVVAGVAGLIVIHFFLGVIRRIGVWPFVAYRVALGVAILAWLALAE